MARWDEVEEEADPVRNGWTECVGIYKSCRSEIGEAALDRRIWNRIPREAKIHLRL